jgi:hypothetical protein
MSSLLGTLTLDKELLTDMIRSEKYNVEMCIERYLELIEVFDTDDFANSACYDGQQESSPHSDCTFPSSSSSTNSSNGYDGRNGHLITNDIVKDSGSIQNLCDENDDEGASAGVTQCGGHSQSNFISERSEYSLGFESDKEAGVRRGSEKENYFTDDYASIEQNERLECSANLEFEKEREQVDLAMNYTNQRGNGSTYLSDPPYTGNDDFSNGQYFDTLSYVVDRNPLSLSPEGEMEVYMSIFEGLIDQSELRTFWRDSYLQNSSNSAIEVHQKVDYTLVMNDAISFALVHLDDEESDWNEVVHEAEMMNSSNSNNEVDFGNSFSNVDTNVISNKDINNNIGNAHYTYHHCEGDREGNYRNIGVCNDHSYPENYYNTAYGYDVNTDESLNYDLIEQLASREEEEYIQSRMQQNISTREALTGMVKNVIGDLKSKFSDNFIIRVLGTFDYNLDKTVEFLMLNQNSQSVAENVLRNVGASNGHNVCNKFADSSFSYAAVLSSNMNSQTLRSQAPTGQNGQFYSQNNFTDSQYDFPDLHFAQNSRDHQFRDCLDRDSAVEIVHSNDNNNNRLSNFNPWHYCEENNNNNDNNNDNVRKSNKINNVSNFGVFYEIDTNNNNINNNNNNNNNSNNNNNHHNSGSNSISNSMASEMKYKRMKNQKAKSLQWRLVASKESAKMKESLSRESSQRNLPQINSENRKINSSSATYYLFHLISSFVVVLRVFHCPDLLHFIIAAPHLCILLTITSPTCYH